MDTTLVTGWEALCQQLASAFTQPTLVTFLHTATGWVLCRSWPTVTNLVYTIGTRLLGHAVKHWTVYERFFYRASWSLDEVSRLLFVRVIAPLVRSYGIEMVIDLKIDDTTCGRYGKHVVLVGYFKDASASNMLKTVAHWSHNWVIGCVAMRPKRWPNWVLGLPVWFTLYRKLGDCHRKHPFRTRQQIAAEMIRETRAALPDWVIRVAADGQYATGAVVQAVAKSDTNLVSRIHSDAAIYALPPKCRPVQRGRKPRKGKLLPTPKRLARRKNGWQTVEALVYGEYVKRQVLSIFCLWYHVCKDRPIKLLIVRDPSGRQTDDYMFCTDSAVGEAEIIERFAARWPIEESIHDGKQLGGFEQVQGWCPHTVVRQAPMAMIIQTLVRPGICVYGAKATSAQPKGIDWSASKDHPSYLDMLATLHKAIWAQRINIKSLLQHGVREFWKTLQFTLCVAA